MEQQFYGYMRVSSVEQNVERQRQELVRWGIVEKHIYTDKVSGREFMISANVLGRFCTSSS